MSIDFSKARKENKYIDLCLNINNEKEIFVHRIIICGLSEYIAKLYEKSQLQLNEQKQEIKILNIQTPNDDFSVEDLELSIDFLYDNKIPLNNESLLQVIKCVGFLSVNTNQIIKTIVNEYFNKHEKLNRYLSEILLIIFELNGIIYEHPNNETKLINKENLNKEENEYFMKLIQYYGIELQEFFPLEIPEDLNIFGRDIPLDIVYEFAKENQEIMTSLLNTKSNLNKKPIESVWIHISKITTDDETDDDKIPILATIKAFGYEWEIRYFNDTRNYGYDKDDFINLGIKNSLNNNFEEFDEFYRIHMFVYYNNKSKNYKRFFYEHQRYRNFSLQLSNFNENHMKVSLLIEKIDKPELC